MSFQGETIEATGQSTTIQIQWGYEVNDTKQTIRFYASLWGKNSWYNPYIKEGSYLTLNVTSGAGDSINTVYPVKEHGSGALDQVTDRIYTRTFSLVDNPTFSVELAGAIHYWTLGENYSPHNDHSNQVTVGTGFKTIDIYPSPGPEVITKGDICKKDVNTLNWTGLKLDDLAQTRIRISYWYYGEKERQEFPLGASLRTTNGSYEYHLQDPIPYEGSLIYGSFFTKYNTYKLNSSEYIYPTYTKEVLIGKVNSAPYTPSVELADNDLIQGNLYHADFYLNGDDPDPGQTVTFFYRIHKEKDWQKITNVEHTQYGDLFSLTSTAFNKYSSGDYEVSFKTIDSFEGLSSEIVTKRVRYYQVPKIIQMNLGTVRKWEGKEIEQVPFYKELPIIYTLDQNIKLQDTLKSYIKIQYKTSNVRLTDVNAIKDWRILDYNYFSAIQNGTNITISFNFENKTIPEEVIPYGSFYYFRVSIVDSDYSGIVEGMRPAKPSQLIISNITTDAQADRAIANSFSKYINFDIDVPELYSKQINISQIRMQLRIRSNGQEFYTRYENLTNFFTKGLSNEQEYIIPQKINSSHLLPEDYWEKVLPQNEVKIVFEITDLQGSKTVQVVKKGGQELCLLKAQQIKQLDTLDVNPTVFKPYEMAGSNQNPLSRNLPKEVVISHGKFSAIGTKIFIIKYVLVCDDKEVELESKNYDPLTNLDQPSMILKISEQDFKGYINQLFPGYPNEVYQGQIQVRIIDGFNNIFIKSKNIEINFYSLPIFKQESFQIYHDYRYSEISDFSYDNTYISKTPIPILNEKDILNTKKLEERIFNLGEGIIFEIPLAEDKNNDIKEYRVYLIHDVYQNYETAQRLKKTIGKETLWLILPKDQIPESQLSQGKILYRAPTYEVKKNEACWFKIEAVDSKGNASAPIWSSTFVIIGRVQPVVYSLEGLNVDRTKKITPEGNKDELKIKFNLLIQDLGGSKISNTQEWSEGGPNRTFYSEFPNLERHHPFLLTEYNPNSNNVEPVFSKAIFEIKISNHKLENEYNSAKTFSKTYFIEGPLSDFMKTNPNQQNTFVFEGFPSEDNKIFITTRLKISTGSLKENIEGSFDYYYTSSSNEYTYSEAIPTVAHRSHCVGINTATPGVNDAFVVESCNDQRQVRFKSSPLAHEGTSAPEILIDLDLGSISGAFISGGTW